MVNLQIPEKIRLYVFGVCSMREAAAGPYGCNPRLPHQTAHSLGPDDDVQCDKIRHRAHHTASRVLRVCPVDPLHYGLVVLALSLRLVIIRALAQGKHLKLPVL